MAHNSLVFIDASAFISSFTLDSTHEKATEIGSKLEKQSAQLITSNMVVSEVLTVLSIKHRKDLAIDFGEYIRGRIEIAHPGPDHFERAWQIFKREKSKNISFTDCMSLSLVELFRIPTVFSFDKQFRNRGFTVLA